MKRSDLVQKQQAAMEKFQAIIDKCAAEDRKKTAEEKADFDKHFAEAKELGKEIEDLDKVQNFSPAFDISSKSEKVEVEKMRKRFDFGKIVQSGGQIERLEGVEKEVIFEGSKSWGTNAKGLIVPTRFLFADMADNVEDIATQVAPIENIQSAAIYRQLGCTIHEGLTGKLSVPNIAFDNATVKAEGVASAADTNTTGGVTLSPERYTLTKAWNKEYISVSKNFQRILMLFFEAVDRGISAKVLQVAAAKNVLAGRDTSDTNAAATWADLLSLPAQLNEKISEDGKYVSNNSVYYKLCGTAKDAGSGLMLASNKIAFGKEYLPTGLVDDAADLVYAVWRHMHVGLFDGLDIVIDPYTEASEGKINVTVARMADADMGVNAAASIRNASGL